MDEKFLIENIDFGDESIEKFFNLFYEHDKRNKGPIGELLYKKGFMVGSVNAKLNDEERMILSKILSEAIQLGAWLNWSGRVKFNETKQIKQTDKSYI